MKTPDKIYMREDEVLERMPWIAECYIPDRDTEYIRKEEILGFLGEVSIEVNSFTRTFANDIRAEGANKVISLIKEHIESL